MPPSVAELYAAHPFDHNERYWPCQYSTGEAAAAANELHIQADPVAYLDGLLTSNPTQATMINRALTHLPAEVVYASYGADVAVWTVSNTGIDGLSKELDTVLEDAGYNLTDLSACQSWQYRKHHSMSGAAILAQYTLMQSIKHSLLPAINLPQIIAANAAPDVGLKPKHIDRYSLMPLETKRYNEYWDGGSVKGWDGPDQDVIYEMWLDTPIGFTLLYKGLPNAIAGIAMHGDKELMIYQLQGVRGTVVDREQSVFSSDRYIRRTSSRGLCMLDWRKVIVHIAEEIGKVVQAEQVGIQAGKNNVWTKPRMKDPLPHLTFDEASRLYDHIARRMGFSKTMQDTKGNWHKSL